MCVLVICGYLTNHLQTEWLKTTTTILLTFAVSVRWGFIKKSAGQSWVSLSHVSQGGGWGAVWLGL